MAAISPSADIFRRGVLASDFLQLSNMLHDLDSFSKEEQAVIRAAIVEKLRARYADDNNRFESVTLSR